MGTEMTNAERAAGLRIENTCHWEPFLGLVTGERRDERRTVFAIGITVKKMPFPKLFLKSSNVLISLKGTDCD